MAQAQGVTDFVLGDPADIFRIIRRDTLTRRQVGTDNDVGAVMVAADRITGEGNAAAGKQFPSASFNEP